MKRFWTALLAVMLLLTPMSHNAHPEPMYFQWFAPQFIYTVSCVSIRHTANHRSRTQKSGTCPLGCATPPKLHKTALFADFPLAFSFPDMLSLQHRRRRSLFFLSAHILMEPLRLYG